LVPEVLARAFVPGFRQLRDVRALEAAGRDTFLASSALRLGDPLA
jgi:hypothetical protein